ncbi:lipopolysaccharide biosynthesis protein [Clostridium perfringens]|uniref:lipopolysaccharide biosynthesis protein n=1 Tax=Clostridium perfringens TaxID=1502 RepID=UPI0022479767|nr:lipopolysaccharide biosynthesis protein [Clostridium perfringens]MCX0371849.1 lipopolysaccharide biosynthesis protein [Clostridium perfringens]
MEQKDFKDKLINATKWSTITEIVAKLVTPITNMILARIIAPEAFGVVATITMVMSFADMFTDVGFQKYLIQYNFINEEEKVKTANVAFWTNLLISIVLLMIIVFFKDSIAVLVGNPGLGNVIAISSFQLVLTSFSSIQMALYRRDFDFKTLFQIRIISILIPFVVTIPLALMGFGYWSLIIGSTSMQFFNAVLLTIKSKWKPKIYYSIKILKKMLSFSLWSLIESISIWFSSWVDVFLISSALDSYHIGLYKTSISTVNSLMALITASVIPVFFSTMSRMQNDDEKFSTMYFNTQRLMSYIVFPIGVGVFLYKELITKILLGDQWLEAAGIIGCWGLVKTIYVVVGNLASEVYRAKGRPQISLLSQIIYLLIFIPGCSISIKFGFWTFLYVRCFIVVISVIIDMILMKIFMNISIIEVVKNLVPAICATIFMGVFGVVLKQFNEASMWSFISISICCVIYLGLLIVIPKTRKDVINIKNLLNVKFKRIS